MDYERNQLGQVTALYYPDTTSKSGMQMDFSYTSLGKVDTITRSPDTLVDYDYAGSNVLSRSYPDPTNDVHYTLAYDSFGRVTRHHTYQDGTPDVEIADFNYTYDDNGNILTQDFAHRTSSPDNIYTYDDLDRLTEADYLVGVLTEDEQFTYDLLGNRLTLNNRADSDVAYTHNIANEYSTIGGQTVSHDAPGNLSVDVNGYKYFYDYENRLEKVQNSSDVVKAEYTYDALGRRIEKYDAAAGTRTRYYYDGWRVLSETNAAGTVQREYVYGNYLDEVLIMVDSSDNDHYYAHDHLFSAVALLDESGAVVERYEYDAYGELTRLDPDFTAWGGTEAGNPYYFTGQRLDVLDSGNFKVMYYKNRYYDTNTGRFLQRDPIGYIDGLNLYNYVLCNPLSELDELGLLSAAPTPKPLSGNSSQGIFEKIIRRLIRKVEDAPDKKTRCKALRTLYATIANGGNFKGYTDAARFMSHWLRGAGTPKHVSEEFLRSDNEVGNFIRDVFHDAVGDLMDTFCLKDSGSTSQKERQIHPYNNKKLFFAMGSFTMRGYATYKKDDSCACNQRLMTLIFDVVDTYDWHKDKKTNVAGIRIPDKYALELQNECDDHQPTKPKPFDLGFSFSDEKGCIRCTRR